MVGKSKEPIPSNWTRLNVAEWRKQLAVSPQEEYSNRLYIKKRTNSVNIYASWLPNKAEDPREIKGKKRREHEWSTGTTDPCDAAQRAIKWQQDKQKKVVAGIVEKGSRTKNSLEHYWEKYIKDFEEKKQNDRGKVKDIREENNKWNSPTYGLDKEDFAHKRVDLIVKKDLVDYFDSLAQGNKAMMKTFINKLWEIAEDDFEGHSFPSFPPIGRSSSKDKKSQAKEKPHYQQDEWDTLMRTIVELSGGAAQRDLSKEEYQHLPTNFFRKKNQKLWVDLFDALWVQYFWFLRAEDHPRLCVEWFTYNKSDDDEEVNLNLKETKGYRPLEVTTHYRSDAVEFWQRLSKRRGKKGWLICPDYPDLVRGVGQPEKKILNDLNYLLKEATKECLPDFDPEKAILTNVRHTSFRHHLENDESLGANYLKLKQFADNGMTSPEMLKERYLNFISKKITAKETRKKQPRSQWSLYKGK